MPRLGMNTRITAEKMPGKVRGRVTRKKVSRGVAPRSEEASSRDFCSFSMELYRGSTAKGSMLVIMPSTTRPSV